MGPHPTPNSGQEQQFRNKMSSSPSQPLQKATRTQSKDTNREVQTQFKNKIPCQFYIPDTISMDGSETFVSGNLSDPGYKVHTITLEESKN